MQVIIAFNLTFYAVGYVGKRSIIRRKGGGRSVPFNSKILVSSWLGPIESPGPLLRETCSGTVQLNPMSHHRSSRLASIPLLLLILSFPLASFIDTAGSVIFLNLLMVSEFD
ncbi:hypothetical protein YC2023_052303 [Brassica napus]